MKREVSLIRTALLSVSLLTVGGVAIADNGYSYGPPPGYGAAPAPAPQGYGGAYPPPGYGYNGPGYGGPGYGGPGYGGPWNNGGPSFNGPWNNRGSGFSGPWNNGGPSFNGPWNNNRGSGFSGPWNNRGSGWGPFGGNNGRNFGDFNNPFRHRSPGSWFNPDKDNMSRNWDDMLNAPSRMGRMPGGWEAPSVSVPNPIDVGDEFEDAARDIPDQMRNFNNNY